MPEATPPVQLTELLDAWRAGDGRAFESLINATHAQLRQMADERMRRAGPMTLAPQDLLNEAVVRLLESPPDLRNRSHFFATMSLLMRSIVVDFARARVAEKRGGGAARVTFTESVDAEGGDVFEVLALDDALNKLAQVDPRGADVLHLHYFAGLKQDQVADLMKVSVKTIERDLRFARAWLEQAMAGG